MTMNTLLMTIVYPAWSVGVLTAIMIFISACLLMSSAYWWPRINSDKDALSYAICMLVGALCAAAIAYICYINPAMN